MKNTPAEKILLSMIKHSNDLTEKRRKKEVYERPERVAERKRIKAGSGEKMRKPGTKGAPTKKAFTRSAKTAKKRKKK